MQQVTLCLVALLVISTVAQYPLPSNGTCEGFCITHLSVNASQVRCTNFYNWRVSFSWKFCILSFVGFGIPFITFHTRLWWTKSVPTWTWQRLTTRQIDSKSSKPENRKCCSYIQMLTKTKSHCKKNNFRDNSKVITSGITKYYGNGTVTASYTDRN